MATDEAIQSALSGIPNETLNTALRFLASVPFDDMPRTLPDDDGATLAAVLVYSQLERMCMVDREIDGDTILWSITPVGIRRMQEVDVLP